MAATVRRFAERVLTGATTLKQQGRNTVDYVTAACEASVDPGVVWTRMASLAEGARLASREFW